MLPSLASVRACPGGTWKASTPLVSVAAAADEGQPFTLIYADQAVPGGIVVDDKALGLLRTLRNQAVMAFRQAG